MLPSLELPYVLFILGLSWAWAWSLLAYGLIIWAFCKRNWLRKL